MILLFRRILICGLLYGGLLIGANQKTVTQASVVLEPGNVQDLLSRWDQTFAALQDYQVTETTETNNKRQQARFFFKRPDLVRIDTREGQVAVQPNGSIRGRLGHGLFGWISVGLSRADKRLQDTEGVPFYQSHFQAVVARIRQQLQQGATATMDRGEGSYTLDIRAARTLWTYTLDRNTFLPVQSSRWIGGKQMEKTLYSAWHVNSGLKTSYFEF
jgi:outer membrane lipoprotein-sorting protein